MQIAQRVKTATAVTVSLPSRAEWLWIAHNGDAATKFPWGNGTPPKSLCTRESCLLRSSPDDVTRAGVRNLASTALEWATGESGAVFAMGEFSETGLNDAGIRYDGSTVILALIRFGFRCVKPV